MIDFEPVLRIVHDLPLSQFVRSAVWAYPILEMLHLIGIGLLFGPIIIFDMRVLGVIRASNPPALAGLLLPWVWTGFLINAASGLLLFASDAIEFAANPAFQAKMALICVSGLNAALFHARTTPEHSNGSARLASAAVGNASRLQAALSIITWFSVIVAGRLMAYVA